VTLYKQSSGTPLTFEETHALETLRPAKIQLTGKSYSLDINLQSLTLKSILSPSDELFLSFEFPSMRINQFMDCPITDFLCAVAILGDVNNVNQVRNRQLILVESKNLIDSPEEFVDDLMDTMTVLPRNSLRFYQNYLEAKKWHEAISVSPDDLKIFKEMLTLTRGDLTRRRRRKQKVAAP
jgi:hypothetical protein